jgi:hypothetical protein
MFRFKSIALSALLVLGTSQLPQGVDAAAALTSSISDNDTTTTYSSLNPQVRTLIARSLTLTTRSLAHVVLVNVHSLRSTPSISATSSMARRPTPCRAITTARTPRA